jgi:monomeric sarcosine oxidase
VPVVPDSVYLTAGIDQETLDVDHPFAMTSASYDVAVIGAGVFGAWTAYRLRQQGASVILIDQYGAGNSLASSGGETRIMRRGYGPDEIYSRSADRSLEQWRQLSDRTGHSLFYRTGVLWLAREDDPYSVSTLETFERIGVAFEKLGRVQLSDRYPQIQLGPVAWAIFEPDGGALMARRGVQCVVQEAKKNGVTYLQDSVSPLGSDGKLTSVLTVSGRRIEAGVFIFSCGPWLPKVFPDLLDGVIQVSRQEVFHFAVPQGDSRFSPPAMPVWIDFNDLVYAIPNVENNGFKIAIDAHGPEFDPDTGDRAATQEGLHAVRAYLSNRLPALADAELVNSQVCQYENTSNGDFLIDWHPSMQNVLLVGGGSGHGFKHGPAVGDYVASLIFGGGKAEPRFSLSSKETIHRRQVY